jgi:hypothetical protein
MKDHPATTPLPTLVFMPPQSPRTTPVPTSAPPKSKKAPSPESKDASAKSSTAEFPLPKLRLEIRDLNHDGAQAFLTAVTANKALQKAVQSVLSLLYHSKDSPTTTVPPTRSVTLILRSMPGVAYTTGSEIDSDHKEIHFSLDYIHSAISNARKTEEIMGVLTHEMVHCYQYNALGTCPGGKLILILICSILSRGAWGLGASSGAVNPFCPCVITPETAPKLSAPLYFCCIYSANSLGSQA